MPDAQVDQARVVDAARRAQIDGFIKTLPEGYQTTIGESGVRISGGQWQRIGIARALYQNPSLIIFDEATSALDNNTERDVMNAIEELHNSQTIILIAHRLTTVQKADVIFIFDEGHLIAQGTYDELLKTCNHFQKMVTEPDD